MRILWEFYEEGYRPWYFPESQRDSLKDLANEAELEPRQIYFFDDSFGKTTYYNDVELSRNFANILDNISNSTEVFIIITSREEIYKKFQHDLVSNPPVEPKKLGLKVRPYPLEKRKEMLLKWAYAMNCEWLSVNDGREKLLEQLDKYSPVCLCDKEVNRVT